MNQMTSGSPSAPVSPPERVGIVAKAHLRDAPAAVCDWAAACWGRAVCAWTAKTHDSIATQPITRDLYFMNPLRLLDPMSMNLRGGAREKSHGAAGEFAARLYPWSKP